MRNWPNLQEKRPNMVLFHDLLGASQHSKKGSEKIKPSSLIVMILYYTKNLQLKLFVQYNDIGNFKILQLLL